MKLKQHNIFYVIILMVMFVAACKFAGFGGGSGNGLSSDPKEAVIGSLKNLQQVKSWSGNMATETNVTPGVSSKADLQYLAPDKFKMEIDAGGSKMEAILIGSDVYLKLPGKDRWQKSSSNEGMGQMFNNWKDMYNDERIKAFKNVQFVGEDTVNGKKNSVYTYDIDSEAAMKEEDKAKMTDETKKMIAGMENKAKIWIDADKNLPSKIEITGKTMQPKEMTNKVIFDYNYDKEVKIEAPQL